MKGFLDEARQSLKPDDDKELILDTPFDFESLKLEDDEWFSVRSACVYYSRSDDDEWFSAPSAYDYYSFTRDEAHRLVWSAGVPLFGRIPLEKHALLDPDKARLERFFFGNDLQLRLCPSAWDVYEILEALVDAFNRVDMRVPRAFSQGNVERVTIVTKRLRMLIQALDEPSTKLFNGGKPMDDFVRDCKAQLAKFNRWADILDRTSRDNDGDRSLENFIRGPLAGCYKRLYDRNAGGNEKGPFARFGACFFEMCGYKVAPGTISRAVKKTPRSSKKLALEHRAA
jgi:hypothetical protein